MNGLVKTTKFLFSPNIYKRTSKVNKNTEIVILPSCFFKKNDIPVSGKPFVIYHTYDMARLAKISICVP
jgi:hypothetical protein